MEKRDPASEGRLRTRASQRVFLILRQVPDRTLITVKARGRAGLIMADVEDSVRRGLRGYRWHTLQKNMHTLKEDCFTYLFFILVADWLKAR
ncbi:hypothetical protein LTS18_008548, partial [Coniosporium uncinatum]